MPYELALGIRLPLKKLPRHFFRRKVKFNRAWNLEAVSSAALIKVALECNGGDFGNVPVITVNVATCELIYFIFNKDSSNGPPSGQLGGPRCIIQNKIIFMESGYSSSTRLLGGTRNQFAQDRFETFADSDGTGRTHWATFFLHLPRITRFQRDMAVN